MRTNIKISNVCFSPAKPQEALKGLRGWISCCLNGRIQFEGIALRRTRGGRHTLSFPARLDNVGRRHFYIRPLDDAARRVIERQVFQELGIREKSA
jgi:hypothetical protein